ncbi:patatin-like phospholipase domain-containing protein 2 isoform X2 [Takifugu flavidus]|nr:patatin-like phospholipase domain-containing protein 2 isoform X2 [Takifugu flavidus]
MAPGVFSCHHQDVPPSISFSGSGFMATYQLGVAQCLLNYVPWKIRSAPCVLGVSAGSLVAAAVVCEVSLVSMRDEMLNFAKQLKAFMLGPFNPSVNLLHWLEMVLYKHLPSNAHHLANGRLAVAMTRMDDGKLIIKSEFESKEDVVQALLCSCFVPGYCGITAPSIKGVHYLDGGFTSMLPVLPVSCSDILTVCPFSGETDICPRDPNSMLDMVVSGTTLKGNIANTLRIINALYPMALETLEEAYKSGYRDAINFLLSKDLVPYLTVHEEFQGPLKPNKEKLSVPGETDKEVTEGKKEVTEGDREALTTFTDVAGLKKGNSEVQKTNGNHSFHFGMMKNALLGSIVSYFGMFGLPARILYYLFLPVMVSYYTAVQGRHRLELLYEQTCELLFWTYQCLRFLTIFMFNVFICTLEKNLKDRMIPFILLLKWLKPHLFAAIQEQRKAAPYLHPDTQAKLLRPQESSFTKPRL